MSASVPQGADSRNHPIPEVVLRTRRSVMEAANEMHAQRLRRRRQFGIALLALGCFVVLVTPAVWNALNDLTNGEHFFDMPVMVLTLSMLFLSAVFAVLLATWRDSRRRLRDE